MAQKTASKPAARSAKPAKKKAPAKRAAAKPAKKAPAAKGKTNAKGKTTAAKGAKADTKKGPKAKATGEAEVKIDRRRAARRTKEEAAEAPQSAKAPTAAPLERREKVNRRRQIDPTTCERDYSDAEVEFMNALDEYKRTSGRMFPTCSEVLEVIRGLGYAQLTPAELAARAPEESDTLEAGAEQEAIAALDESDGLRVDEEPQD